MTRPALVAGLALAALARAGMAAGAGKTWDFEGDAVGAPPAGFSFGRTGRGSPGKWEVRLDPSSPAGDHVLAQVEADGTDYRFPVAVADAPLVKDVRVEVRCKPVSGKVDRACGLVVRYRDADNYYLARANALEDNVNLYHVVRGRRREIKGWSGTVSSNAWHTLTLEVRGNHLQVFWEGKAIIDAKDETLGEAGKVGLWTKADSVTYFDALAATALP